MKLHDFFLFKKKKIEFLRYIDIDLYNYFLKSFLDITITYDINLTKRAIFKYFFYDWSGFIDGIGSKKLYFVN